LKKTLGRKLLSSTELETTLFEIEACVNSRPLTFVSDVMDDFDVITPSQVITDRTSLLTTPSSAEDDSADAVDFRERRVLCDARVKAFWDKWTDLYLRELPVARAARASAGGGVKCGDLVLMEEPAPRARWPLGRIKTVHPGRDGVIRTVDVMTRSGVVTRPLKKLRLLEL
jgi:hypothetical protein